MLQPGRTYSAGDGYRYGFNGKENDNEVKGEGNQQDYGMRIYDPRLGRFLSVDPLMKGYPMLTAYQYAANRPIDGIDLDGLEFWKEFFGVGVGIAEIITKNKYANDVATGFYKRAKGTVMGLWDLITGSNISEKADSGPNPFMTGFANNPANMQTGQIVADAFESMIDGIISDYGRIIRGTVAGDGEAAGELLFEAFMFFVPELKGATSSKIFEETTRSFDFAIDALKNGQRAFENLDEVIVASSKGDGVGSMVRLEYEGAPYHGIADNPVKSKGPINGQEALDNSLQVRETSPRRIGIDYDAGEFVIFDETGKGSGVFHGHVRPWEKLSQEMKNTLINAGMADRKGRILTD